MVSAKVILKQNYTNTTTHIGTNINLNATKGANYANII